MISNNHTPSLTDIANFTGESLVSIRSTLKALYWCDTTPYGSKMALRSDFLNAVVAEWLQDDVAYTPSMHYENPEWPVTDNVTRFFEECRKAPAISEADGYDLNDAANW